MNKKNRILAVCIAAILALSLIPLYAFANVDTSPQWSDVYEGTYYTTAVDENGELWAFPAGIAPMYMGIMPAVSTFALTIDGIAPQSVTIPVTGTVVVPSSLLGGVLLLEFVAGVLTVRGNPNALTASMDTTINLPIYDDTGLVSIVEIVIDLTLPGLTINPTPVYIDNANLTATATVGGTATGTITIEDDTALPTGVTASISGNVITVTGVRPTLLGASINGTFLLWIARGTDIQPLPITVDLSAPAVYLYHGGNQLDPANSTTDFVLIDDGHINPTNRQIVQVEGGAIGDITLGALPLGVGAYVSQVNSRIYLWSVRPQHDTLAPPLIGFHSVTVTREGVTTMLSIYVDVTPNDPPDLRFVGDPYPANPVVTINDANLVGSVTIDPNPLISNATGPITHVFSPALPVYVTAFVNQTTGVITFTGRQPSHLVVAGVVETVTMTITRQGVSRDIEIDINLSPLPPPTLDLSATTITINNANPSVTIAVTGTASGNITTDPASLDLPHGVRTTTPAGGNSITFGRAIPAYGQSAESGTFQVDVIRQGVRETLTVIVDLTPQPRPEINFTPASVTINDAAPSASVQVSGTAVGTVRVTGGNLPDGVRATASGTTVIVTGTRPSPGQPDIVGTFYVEITREGVAENLDVTVNLTPPSLDITPDEINITNENLIQTVSVGGDAIGNFSLSHDRTLPAWLLITPNQNTNTIEVRGTPPPHTAPANREITVITTITRQGVSETLTIVVDMEPMEPPSLEFDPDTVTLNAANITATSDIGGTAVGAITHNAVSVLPNGVVLRINETTGVITVEGTRPAPNTAPLEGTYVVTITRQNVSEEFTIILEIPPVDATLHDITIIAGGTGYEATPNPAAVGQTISLDAGTPPAGQRFVGWTTTIEGVTIQDYTSIDEATFVMIDAPVVVRANWEAIPTAVTSIILTENVWQIGEPFPLRELSEVLPTRAANIRPNVNCVNWEIISVTPEGGGTLTARLVGGTETLSAATILTDGQGVGVVRLRATIPDGRADGTDFTQEFTITFSSQVVLVTVQGLENLFIDSPVTGRILFTLQDGVFVDNIFESDFWVSNLPPGLQAETPVRLNNTQVAINITGAPTQSTTVSRVLNVPNTIPARNIRGATRYSHVVRQGLTVRSVTASAGVFPNAITFDLNPYGVQHRDFTVTLQNRDLIMRNIRYGGTNLHENREFSRDPFNNYRFTIYTDFLARLPIGEWDLTFMMNRGVNPTVRMNIIDSAQDTPYEPYIPVGPPPTPPMTPIHPNENFMFMTGGVAVNMDNLRWDIDRARVTPAVHDGVAELTVRTHVLDYLSWLRPGSSFEIMTPMMRLRVPAEVLDSIFGGRATIIERGLDYSQVDLRFTITDRSNDPALTSMFANLYPNGELLSPLVDLRVELIDAQTGAVILTANEFSQPLDMTFVVMGNAGHLRPAGVMFQRAWLEFIPYRTLSPNEITTSSIFPGTQGVMHNRVHFEDIYTRHWGFMQTYTAAYSGIIVPMGLLHPETPITRGEFAQLLSLTLQLPRAEANVSGFTDVLPPNVFFDGVSRLFAAGLLGPYVSGAQFNPNGIITREEVAAITGMAVMRGEPVRPQQNDLPLSRLFTDFADFSVYHVPNIQAAANHGVMIGYPDNSFRPQAPATRIYSLEAVIRLARVLGLIDEV